MLAAHKWEEQFRVKGERVGTPPADKLVERIQELLREIDASDNEAAKRSLAREVAWRRIQLERLRDAAGG
jgi:hypothetical protein